MSDRDAAERHRRDMASHLRALADALENPKLSTVPVDWSSILKRVETIVADATKADANA